MRTRSREQPRLAPAGRVGGRSCWGEGTRSPFVHINHRQSGPPRRRATSSGLSVGSWLGREMRGGSRATHRAGGMGAAAGGMRRDQPSQSSTYFLRIQRKAERVPVLAFTVLQTRMCTQGGIFFHSACTNHLIHALPPDPRPVTRVKRRLGAVERDFRGRAIPCSECR